MKKDIFKKSLIFVIILLFVGVTIFPTISSYYLKVEKNNLELSNISFTNNKHTVPRLTDSSGKTKFHGVFVGVPFDKEAQDLADALAQHPGWKPENMTVLKDNNATRNNISLAIEKARRDAKPGDEVVIYFGTHGGDDRRKDGVKDPEEGEKDPKDDPNKYDNHIFAAGWVPISDDELTHLIEGFERCVTITVIIDSCYSGTFTDGTADLPSAEDAGEGWEDPEKYGSDHLSVLTSGKGSTPGRSKGKTFTDKIIDSLKMQGGYTIADTDKDGNTTSEEMAKFVKTQVNQIYKGDNDGDNMVDEDDVDYYTDPNTGEITILHIDNDGDGLIDEDIAPTNPYAWYIPEWYVDADASPGGDGSIDNPYQSIQIAIDSADDGDKIYVLGGTYNENIVINKDGLTLKGGPYLEERPPLVFATIDGSGSGNTCTITGDHVSISGFNFINCGSYEEDAAVDIQSNYNTIYGNYITDNQATGINLHQSACYNYIYSNIISDNDGAGIFIWESSDNNYLHHNNLFNNGWFNAKDYCDNIWDDAYHSTGNYWDDWDGSGSYSIQGGSNQDRYPSNEANSWNTIPEKLLIDGTTSGKKGAEYEYDFEIDGDYFGPGSDPFEEFVYCHIEWGDETDEWIGPFIPGARASVTHSWDEDGDYMIRAKAFDAYGEESDWATLEVSMPKNKAINTMPLFLRFLENHPYMFPILRILIQRI
jgi:parallel beta-helix repeat protein